MTGPDSDPTPDRWWAAAEADVDKDDGPTFGEVDQEDDPDADLCPMGGEHDIVTIHPATMRVPMLVYCRRCKQEFTETNPQPNDP